MDRGARRTPGRPRIDREVEQLIVRMAEENRSWGYDRIVGALANLGHEVSDQTVGNVLRRHGLPPAPARKANDHLGSIHSGSPGGAGGDRLFGAAATSRALRLGQVEGISRGSRGRRRETSGIG
jgi:hypothetical protein